MAPDRISSDLAKNPIVGQTNYPIRWSAVKCWPPAGQALRMTMQFEKLNVLSAYQVVSRELRRMIVSGELKAGAQLPTETELAEQFGVNRSTVREGIRQLENEGSRQPRGAQAADRVGAGLRENLVAGDARAGHASGDVPRTVGSRARARAGLRLAQRQEPAETSKSARPRVESRAHAKRARRHPSLHRRSTPSSTLWSRKALTTRRCCSRASRLACCCIRRSKFSARCCRRPSAEC